MTLRSLLSSAWKWLAAAAAILIGLAFWKRREDRASGAREARQEQEDQKAKAVADDLRLLRLKDAQRLARRLEQEAAEAEARRAADAEIAAPEPASEGTEAIVERLRRERGIQ